MKLNIANPSAGLQKTFEIDDEKKLLPFFEKRMGAEVPGDTLGDEFKGYVFRIGGGNDKEGFPMMQGVLVNHRVRILFRKGMKCYRPRRTGEMKRKSIRGAIVGPDLAVLSLILIKKGKEDIGGLTDGEKPRRLGPKRANKLRKLFNLSKNDDVRKFVIRRQIDGKNKKKAPKIQRLITKSRIARKVKNEQKILQSCKNSRAQKEEYNTILHKYKLEQKEKKVVLSNKKKEMKEKKEEMKKTNKNVTQKEVRKAIHKENDGTKKKDQKK